MHLVWSQRLLPAHVLPNMHGHLLHGHLLQHALQESSVKHFVIAVVSLLMHKVSSLPVVIHNGEESWILAVPASNVSQQLIQVAHVINLTRTVYIDINIYN